jgi:hypothetical protein
MQSRVATEEQRRITAAQQTQLQAQQMQQQNFQHSLNMLNYNLQQQNRTALRASQPIAPVTCQQFGGIVRCY